MKNYDAIIFDMDGVIFDSEREVMKCWIELSNKYGLKDILVPYYRCIGTTKEMTKSIMLDFYGNDFSYEKYAAEASKMFHEKFDNGSLPIKKGVREFLDYLKCNNKKIALASSTRRETVELFLKLADLYMYFDKIICGDMVNRSKPNPDIFLKACDELQIDTSDAYVIEDSYNGVKASYAANIKCIMVPDLLKANEEMNSMATCILDDMISVQKYLNS